MPSATSQQPPKSSLQTLLTTTPNHPHHNLALQIAHNLHHQHLWTSLRLHTHTNPPLISGLPPSRLYIHPDEQIALLQQQKDLGKTGMPNLAPQREWVLPSHLREKWSLRRFGEVFDAIEAVPEGGEVILGDEREGEVLDGLKGDEEKWRKEKPKRVLLATLDDDSTVVYYIVHDGIVKPRQN